MVPTVAAVTASKPMSVPVGITILFREFDKVLVIEQRACAENDSGLSAPHQWGKDRLRSLAGAHSITMSARSPSASIGKIAGDPIHLYTNE
jgi:hypothetical protein